MTANCETLNLLLRHFPDANSEKLKMAAYEIDVQRSMAIAMQTVQRSTKSLPSDIETLLDSQKALKKAEDKLRGLGLHGGELLTDAAHRLESFSGDAFEAYRPSRLTSIQIVANAVRDIRQEIEKAVELARKAPKELHRQKSKRGTPEKVEAAELTSKLYDVFWEISGQEPKVSNDRITDKKYGPFLEFVKEAFDHFGIIASPERAAKECRAKKTKNQ